MLTIGSPIPSFSLSDQDGKLHESSEYQGKWLLIYFYPADDTPGCTKEACTFRDHFDVLKEKGIEIIGISTNTVESHKKFAEKHQLPFTLLADPEKVALKGFDVGMKNILSKILPPEASRVSFLIDPDGVIQKVYEKVNPGDHAKQILRDWEQIHTGS